MEEKNEIIINQTKITKNENIIVNIGKDLEKDLKDIPEIKEENLYCFFFNKDIYNKRCSKIKEKEKFIALLKIINNYFKERKEFIFFYFKERNIDIIKIILNGFITQDIKDQELKSLLISTMKNIIDLFFSRKIFYFVYNKLSKIFRKFKLVENKEILFNKFHKLFYIWNFLFDINEKHPIKTNYFCFIGNKVLTLENKDDKYPFNNIDIYIEFEEGIDFLPDDFSLVSAQYADYGIHSMKLEGILSEKEKKEINNIFVRVDRYSIRFLFNIEEEFKESNYDKLTEIMRFDTASDFSKIEILKNYVGKIRNIYIIVNFQDTNIDKIIIEISPSRNKDGYQIVPDSDIHKRIEIFFDNKPLYSKIYPELLYEDIRYYGGMECFIPIIKIIKYFMVSFKENKDKIDKLNNMLISIIKNIIKLVIYSKSNFDNFKKILTSLLGALAEINNIFPEDSKNNLFSHYCFSIIYIIMITVSMPYSLKKAYIMITGLYNLDKLNLNFEELILDVNDIKTNSYQWYTTILIMIIEFILLKYNNPDLIPKKIIEQLNILQKILSTEDGLLQTYLKCIFSILNYLCSDENKEIKLFENYEKIDDASIFFENYINNERNLVLILNMMKIYFNIINFDSYWFKFNEELSNKKKENTEKEIEENQNIYKNKFINFFNNFEKFSSEQIEFMKNIVIQLFEEHIADMEYLIKIFPFLNSFSFKLESEIILLEFIDFHKDYHNLMKNLFIFNKYWSDKKLFFSEDKRTKYLKYSTINYYTKHYQKPLISPKLDYKNSYPNFTEFKIEKDFYTTEENPDDYNFNFDCIKLDSFNINYENKLLHNIKSKNKMNIFEVCLVKKTHHIKGKLVICTDNSSLMSKILFISYPSHVAQKIPCCNVSKSTPNYNKKKDKLCYGAIFVCPEKYMNIKIVIDIKDIRMILKRIYFYRKSAVEIFTTNKSYYFNFADDSDKNTANFSEKNCENFINMFGFYISEFFPIIITKEIIGYSRQFQEMLEKYKDSDKKYDINIGNKFIPSLFVHWASNIKGIEYSTLDLLIYLNLLSNRSYNDLFQYPVFPLLFFYDKDKDNKYHLLDRKLNLHIGFQTVSDKAKQRKNLIIKSFNTEEKNEEEEEEEEEVKFPSYFKTHFSTHFYTCNFQVRNFPYTFISIELQGTGFDDPNRLFSSVEETFFNISCQKSDLRELIPEFYYFPELFLNLNKINFNKKASGHLVDDVMMPQDTNKIDKDKNNYIVKDNYEKSNYFLIFKFIEQMRNLLESKQTDIISWIKIIFGPGQKYNNPKKEDLFFRNESYIDYTMSKAIEFRSYRKDKAFMASVEFGMTPVQTVFDGDTVKNKNRYNFYDLKLKDDKEYYRRLCKIFTDKIELEEKNKIDNINENEINDETDETIFIANYPYKIINKNKNKIYNKVNFKLNKSNVNNKLLDPNKYINCIYKNSKFNIVGYKTGKVEVFNKKYDQKNYHKMSEFFDHYKEIIHIHYNSRLNMMSTTSKDGFINIYILPKKLITAIKNPNNGNYFNYVFLCSNPFPAIIAIDKKNLEVFSYSINGFLIKKLKPNMFREFNEKNKDLWFFTNFNENGGTFKDRLIFIERQKKEKECIYKCYLVRVPFFEMEDKIVEIKYKCN